MWFDGDFCGECWGIPEKSPRNPRESPSDLFETIETLPYKVQLILSGFAEDDHTYEACADLLSRCEAEGYTFEYGLDAIPYQLTKIK